MKAALLAFCVAICVHDAGSAPVGFKSDDLTWKQTPQAWHQQAARIADHRFSTFAELRTFAANSKKA